jgi:hypothetical protein
LLGLASKENNLTAHVVEEQNRRGKQKDVQWRKKREAGGDLGRRQERDEK